VYERRDGVVFVNGERVPDKHARFVFYENGQEAETVDCTAWLSETLAAKREDR